MQQDHIGQFSKSTFLDSSFTLLRLVKQRLSLAPCSSSAQVPGAGTAALGHSVLSEHHWKPHKHCSVLPHWESGSNAAQGT